MIVDIDIHKFVYNFKTKYEEGFTSDEIKMLFHMFKGLNEDKFNNALMCVTCMSIDNEIVIYHCDIELALKCAIENRDLKNCEFD